LVAEKTEECMSLMFLGFQAKKGKALLNDYIRFISESVGVFDFDIIFRSSK
jgi:hypothetical protein